MVLILYTVVLNIISLVLAGEKMNWCQTSGGSGKNSALPALKRYLDAFILSL